MRLRSSGTALHLVGSYRDDFVKTAAGWRFAKRTVQLRYEEDIPVPARIFIDRDGAAPPPSATESIGPERAPK